jgi:GT2 family glycosyltransferase
VYFLKFNIPSGVRAVLNCPLLWLFYRIQFRVKRTIGIKAGTTYCWAGEDPQLHLVADNAPYLPLCGYYMLEINQSAYSGAAAALYIDTGNGFNEQEVYPLTLKPGQISKRVCFFPKPVRRLRFDPSVTPGEIKGFTFRLIKLTAAFAHQRMRQKILNCAPYYASDFDSPTHDLPALYERVIREKRLDYTVWQQNIEPTKWLPLTASGPLFSIIVPVYNTPAELLRTCVESVLNQSYQRWELLLVDDCSTNAETKIVLAELANADVRVKVITRTENGHISVATNTGIESAGGEFIGFLDHDDTLAPQALNEVACLLMSDPELKLVYSDEDKITATGGRFDPYFKPDFNRELLLAHNYICHFCVINTALVKEVGGLRVGYEGSQDYDLLLRCIPKLADREIGHIAKILYHWRAVDGSTALAAGEKSYSWQAGLKAVNDYVSDNGLSAKVENGPVPNSFHIKRVPDDLPLVSIIIPTRDRADLVRTCVESIVAKTTYARYEIIVVDNQSSDPQALAYFERLQRDGVIKLVRYDNEFNYSAINNYAIKHHASGECLVLMNNDIEVLAPDWLTEMVSYYSLADMGCVGAKLFYPDGRIQHAGVTLGIGGVAGHTHKYFEKDSYGYFSQLVLPREVSAVTAACLLVKRSVYEEVGGLEEEHLKIAFNDVDFCLKVKKAGYRNFWTPYAQLIHHESVSRGHEDTPEKKERFRSEVLYMRGKWSDELEADPFYNPNLTLEHEDFSLRDVH